MGEWHTVYEDEVEERWVTVASIEDADAGLEQNGDGRTPLAGAEAADSSSHLSLIQLRTSRRS
jgi:hypothetical protein